MLVDEHSAIAHINLAEAYANVGRSSEALKVAREAQQLAETSGDKQLIEQVEKMLRSIESMAGAKP
jgi:hypothetical protein